MRPEPTRQKRRPWFQISVRTLLIVLTIFAVWLGVHANAARRQRIAVFALEQAGVQVRYHFEYDAKSVFIPDAELPYPKFLVDVLGVDFFARVGTLECHEGNLDEVSPHFATLQDVTTCVFGGAKLGDDSLHYIAEMRGLKRLGLEYMPITDEGVKPLLKMRNLETAFLMGTKVSAEMIARLEETLPESEFVYD